MEEKETHVDTLLRICENLTVEHIVKTCENLDFQDELTQKVSGEVNYIKYHDKLYRLKPTIRKANDIILNNIEKLDNPKYKKGAYDFTSNDFVKFYDKKFLNETIIQRVRIGDEIDFESIINFAKNYFGKEYRKENNELKKLGKKAYNNFQNFGNMILSDLYNFISQHHNWQNGWSIKNQFWVELKNEVYKDYPFSISLFCDESCDFLITLELNISEQQHATQEQLNNFNKLKQNNISDFEQIDTEYRRFSKKLTGPYISERTDEIVDEAVHIIKELELFYESIFKGENDMPKQPLNQILYGPPGTGKTYNTVVEAIKIIDKDFYNANKDDYKKLKERFDKLKKEHQIEFVTFHQSYSYEEFVEGIKPDLNLKNENGLKYKLENGIFKEICNNAKPIKNSQTSCKIDFSITRIFKMSLGDTTKNENDIYNYCIENNVVSLGFENIDFSSCNTRSDFEKLTNSWSAKALERFKLWMRKGDIILISNGNKNIRAIAKITGDYCYNPDTEIEYTHFRNVEWLYKGENIPINKLYDKNLSQQSIYAFYSEDRLNTNEYNGKMNTNFINEIITGGINKVKTQPYILIIDEINRGNISKIFGELITLIEPDKRKNVTGDDKEYHTLTVTLPYSKEPFTVPNNLYIIGTMNTSDRSIASIDIALRRRFKFVEMMPKAELFENVKIIELHNDKITNNEEQKGLKELLECLNKRISVLLDRDHQIGHSYFIQFQNKTEISINDFKDIWFDEIIPLLNEYFYGDWEKLQDLLGEPNYTSSFIKKLDTVTFARKNTTCDINEQNYDFLKKDDCSDDIFAEAMKNAFSELYKEEKPEEKEKEETNETEK